MVLLKLKDVKNRPELTGKVVQIRESNTAKNLWKVEVDPVECKVKVKGKKSKSKSQTLAECLEVSPSCLVLEESQDVEHLRERDVIISGLSSKPELNGTKAKCLSFVAHKQRWKVALEKQTILLRSQNLTLVGSETCLQDPVMVGESADCDTKDQKGLFAADNLKQGQIIFEEDPLISAPVVNSPEGQAKSYADTFIAASKVVQADALAMYASESFRSPAKGGKWTRCTDQNKSLGKLGMDKSVRPEMQTDVWKFMRVMQTNAFATNNQTQALFATLCRCNHSCSPNALRYDNGSGKTLIALRDICVGEEICICYVSDTQMLEPRAIRSEHLSVWGFACTCRRCSEQVDDMRVFHCDKKCGGVCTEADGRLAPCSSCQAQHSLKSAKTALAQEVALVAKVRQLDQNPYQIGANPGHLDELIVSAGSMVSATHWATARLHNLASDFCQQKPGGADLQKASQHMKAESDFWQHHITRPSQQAAWKRKLYADVLMSLSNFADAFDMYSKALDELKMAMPTQTHHCNQIREKLREALAFRNSEEPQGMPTGKPGVAQQDAMRENIMQALRSKAGESGEAPACPQQ